MEQKQKPLQPDKKLELLKQLKEDYERVFGTSEGKRVLEDLQKSAFIKKTSFNVDTHIMAFNEGARTTVLHVMDMAMPKPKEQLKSQAIKGGDNE